jgi:hypothetical protein
MTPAEVRNQLRSARDEVERICKLLETPTPAVLDRCGAAMQRVIGDLENNRQWIAEAGEIGIAEARRLRPVVRRARALLNLAANYHDRWFHLLSGMSGGYTLRGAPAAPRLQSRLSLRG